MWRRTLRERSISMDMTAEMQRIGELVYREVQGSGVIRVDVMTDHADKMYVLEYNTVPGMTALFPLSIPNGQGQSPQALKILFHWKKRSAALHD